MKSIIFILTSQLLAIATFGVVSAVRYQAINNARGTAGGTRFDQQIGIHYTQQIMSDTSNFIWYILKQGPADRKNHNLVNVFVDPMDGVAYVTNNEVHISASYIGGYSGNVKNEFTGVMYHEMTHVWQWAGQGKAPRGLVEGSAEYVRMKAGYTPSQWVKPGAGDRWDQGYHVTALFLEYCNGLKNDFVPLMNAKMKDGYSNDFFVQLLGKTVDQLWRDYKKKYGN